MEAGEPIVREVGAWEGVSAEAGVLRYGGSELGRVRDGLVELLFHPTVRRMLLETGRVEPGEAGRVRPTRRDDAVELFRLAYERARVAERVRDARESYSSSSSGAASPPPSSSSGSTST